MNTNTNNNSSAEQVISRYTGTALEGLFLGGIRFIGDESFMDCTSLRTVIVFSDCEEFPAFTMG